MLQPKYSERFPWGLFSFDPRLLPSSVFLTLVFCFVLFYFTSSTHFVPLVLAPLAGISKSHNCTYHHTAHTYTYISSTGAYAGLLALWRVCPSHSTCLFFQISLFHIKQLDPRREREFHTIGRIREWIYVYSNKSTIRRMGYFEKKS
jgi:hypothetical protein